MLVTTSLYLSFQGTSRMELVIIENHKERSNQFILDEVVINSPRENIKIILRFGFAKYRKAKI